MSLFGKMNLMWRVSLWLKNLDSLLIRNGVMIGIISSGILYLLEALS